MWQRLLIKLGLAQRTAKHLRVGQRGEAIAAKHLKAKGYRMLGRNVQPRGGEADLVAVDPDGKSIVLVEVKARIGGRHDPQHAVGRDKRRRLIRTLQALRSSHRWDDRPGRIDLVTVWWRDDQPQPDVRHHVNAVSTAARSFRAL